MADWKMITIIILTSLTALGHLAGSMQQEGILIALFIIDGLLFIGFMVAYYWIPKLQDKKDLIRWGYMALAAGTILGYFIMHEPKSDLFAPANLFMKVVETVLIVVLFLDRN